MDNKTIETAVSFLQNWNKKNNPFYPDEMKWDYQEIYAMLSDYDIKSASLPLPDNLDKEVLKWKFAKEAHRLVHAHNFNGITEWFVKHLSKDADDKNCESCKGKGTEVSYEGDEIIIPREVDCSYCGGTGLKNTNLKNNELKKALSQCDYPNCLKDAEEVKELRAEIEELKLDVKMKTNSHDTLWKINSELAAEISELKSKLSLQPVNEDEITITMPEDTASELLSLIQNSNDTGNKEWDTHMKAVEKLLLKKL